jgi:predicted transcriptional regulator
MSSPTHRKKTLERRAKVAQAYQLRVEGLSEIAIAAWMGIAKSTAHEYVTEALAEGMREIHERGRDFVRLELDRLESPVKFLQKRIRRGDSDAIREHRSLSESRRKLLGLDARPDSDSGALEVRVTLQLPPAATARVDRHASTDVRAADADAGRPAQVSVDRDGD